jgi:hypothetical protein
MGRSHGGRFSRRCSPITGAARQPVVNAYILLSCSDGPHSAAQYADATHPHMAGSSWLGRCLWLDRCTERCSSDAGQGNRHRWPDWTWTVPFKPRDRHGALATDSWKRTDSNLHARRVRIDRGWRLPRLTSSTRSIRTARSQSDMNNLGTAHSAAPRWGRSLLPLEPHRFPVRTTAGSGLPALPLCVVRLC